MKASIIIPAYNASQHIQETINTLLNQNFEDYEIIFVDDGSTDGTIGIIKNFSRNKKIKLLKQEHRGPAAARNLGAKKAKGDIIIFTDSDCIPEKNWIREMLVPFKSEDVVGVQGIYKTMQKNLIARFVQFEIENRYEIMKKFFKKTGSIDFIGTYSAAYRRNIFLKEGGFDETFSTSSGEDIEFSYRLANKGMKMIFNPNAFVYHKHPDSLLRYLKTKYKRAYWSTILYKKNKEKIIKDSYTPLSLKAQIISFNLFTLSLIASPIFHTYYISIFLIAFIILLSIPLSYFILQRSFLIGFLTPLILFLRTFVFALGQWKGLVDLLFRK